MGHPSPPLSSSKRSARSNPVPWPNQAVSAACSVLARRYGAYGWLLFLLAGCAGVNGKTLTGAAGGGGGGSPSTGGDGDVAGAGGGGAAGDATDASTTGQGGSDSDAGCGGALGPCLSSLCGNEKLNLPGRDLRRRQSDGRRRLLARLPDRDRLDLPDARQAVRLHRRCGDGMIAGAETCDDHNTEGGRRLRRELPARAGVDLPAGGRALLPRCGDGMKLGSEQCDDGNVVAGGRLQRRLPHRARLRLPDAGPGLPPHDLRRRRQGRRRGVRRRQRLRRRRLRRRLPRRARLRGNERLHLAVRRRAQAAERRRATTATSSPATAARRTCTLEPGWDCRDVSDADDGNLVVPVVYRDFLSRDAPNGHPNFGAGRLRHGRDRHGPGDAGGGPKAA